MNLTLKLSPRVEICASAGENHGGERKDAEGRVGAGEERAHHQGGAREGPLRGGEKRTFPEQDSSGHQRAEERWVPLLRSLLKSQFLR